MTHDLNLMLQKVEDARADLDVRSGIKTLLLHILDDEANAALIEPAIALAKIFSAHLSCVHVTPSQAYVAFGRFGGVFVMSDVMRKIDEANAALELRVEQRLAQERQNVSWDYTQVTADVASTLIERAALADLLILARDPPRHDYVGPTVDFVANVLCHCHTPVLLPSAEQTVFDPAGTLLVAWDGSVEAANAVRTCLPLLRNAKKVQLHTILERSDDRRKPFSAKAVQDFLARHSVQAEHTSVQAFADDDGPDSVKSQIVEEAVRLAADCIVMGGYSHSRLSEFLFGGVTRNFLEASPIAVVMAS